MQYYQSCRFYWDVFESVENHYDFTFFDQVIEKCKEYDLKVMMCSNSNNAQMAEFEISRNYG